MNKKYKISLLILCSFLFTGCPPDDGIITYHKIKSVRALLYSFEESGVYPYLEEFNPEELGLGISPDSLFTRTQYATSFSFGNNAYARSNPNELVYLNAIDSLNVVTIYDFDEDHPAGSNINDILLYLNDMGETFELDINELYSVSHHLKFAAVPKNDSLKFRITGRITDEVVFSEETNLVILE